MVRRRGRRPGTANTREAILTSAQEVFADKSYDRATIRAIAASAAADPALVYHYFGSKEKLFLAAMDLPVDLDVMTQEILNAPRADIGTRLIRLILDICDSPTGTPALVLLLSTMSARPTGGHTPIPIVRRVIAGLGVAQEQVPMRTSLVIAEIMGLVVTRYVLKCEPSASASPDQLAAAIGPTVRHYLIDDLPGVFDPAVESLPSRPEMAGRDGSVADGQRAVVVGGVGEVMCHERRDAGLGHGGADLDCSEESGADGSGSGFVGGIGDSSGRPVETGVG